MVASVEIEGSNVAKSKSRHAKLSVKLPSWADIASHVRLQDTVALAFAGKLRTSK